jgi:hypothetical protein
MPFGIEVSLQFESRTVSLPTVSVRDDTQVVQLPAPLRGGQLDLGRLRLELGTVSLGEEEVQLPIPDIGFEVIRLPGQIQVPTVDFEPGRLATRTVGIPTPLGTLPVSVIDLGGSRLPDVDVGGRSVGLPGNVILNVPEPGVETVTLSLPAVELPDINTSLGSVPLPDVGAGVLARFPLPRITVESEEVAVPRPGTLGVAVDVDTDRLAAALLPPGALAFLRSPQESVLQALTDATGVSPELFTDTPRFVFETVFAELESRVTEATARRIRELTNGFLELVLTEETKQDLRDRTREE